MFDIAECNRHKYGTVGYFWEEGAKEAQRDFTLKQVGVRLDLILKHSPLTGVSFRRAIGLLAEELEKAANNG